MYTLYDVNGRRVSSHHSLFLAIEAQKKNSKKRDLSQWKILDESGTCFATSENRQPSLNRKELRTLPQIRTSSFRRN